MTPFLIEVDVFSGLPNPSWTTDAEETAELDQLLAALEPATSAQVHNGLGYRGFLVMPTKPGLQRLLRIQGQQVAVEDHGVKQFFRDPESRVERWLIAQSAQHLSADIIDLLPTTHTPE